MQAFTQEEFARVQNGPSLCAQPVEPSTSYTVGRVRREFANQSSIGVMLTATKRQLDDDLDVLPDTALTLAASTGICGSRRATRSPATWRAAASAATPEAIERIQENSRHYFQRPDLTSDVADVDAHVAERHRRRMRYQQDRRPARPLQLQRRVQVARLRHQRRRVPAPRRPAQDRQLASVRSDTPDALVPQPEHQLQRIRGVELRRRSPVQRRQRQRARRLRQQLDHRRRLQPPGAGIRRSRDARRPGRLHRRASTKVWYYAQYRYRRSRSR